MCAPDSTACICTVVVVLCMYDNQTDHMPRLLLFIILTGSITAQTWAQGIDYKGFPQWSWHTLDSTEYYLYTPTGMKPGEMYPVALFLHGCCGTSYKATLRNTVDPPVRMWHNFGENTQTVPTYIIAPATSRGWKQHIPSLKKVIDALIAEQQADPRRIYITGFSMGGKGTWDFIDRYPDFFAAALPMGMDFSGDPEKIKHIPIWTNKGETDWYARKLDSQVAVIRKHNGSDNDSSSNGLSGVNPRFTSFKGAGHGVQWVAASDQDLVGWALSKVNDGNVYPNVFFGSPGYRQKIKPGEKVAIDIKATDPDGTISKVELYLNGKRFKVLTTKPYVASFLPGEGDTRIEAVAFDNKGKSTTATTWVEIDAKTRFLTSALPFGRQGAYYEIQLRASGNGKIHYRLGGEAQLPVGLALTTDGLLSGVPMIAGTFNVTILSEDTDGDVETKDFTLLVREKIPGEIVVADAKRYDGKALTITKMMKGVMPHSGRGDDEVTVSDPQKSEGLTLIQLDVNDTSEVSPYLSFTVDDDVTVYVAYEKLDNLFSSTVPGWLGEFEKQPGQIVAQYFYYDVYARDFPKGTISLPAPEKKANRVNTPYFVMVKKRGAEKELDPEINTRAFTTGLDQPFMEQLTALYSYGPLAWVLKKGKLPEGVVLSHDGRLTGIPLKRGDYAFTVVVRNPRRTSAEQVVKIKVE